MEPLAALGTPYSSLRRPVLDPVTGQPVVTSAPTGEVVQRSALLPLGRTDEGRMTLAVPEMALSALGAMAYPGQVARGEASIYGADGRVSDEAVGKAFDLAGTAMTGGIGGVSGSGAVLGAGPVRRAPLAMDEASRLARAAEQGFDTSQRFYHGTPQGFEEFSHKAAGSGSNAGNRERAAFFSNNPAVSDSYLPGYHVRVSGATEHGVADMGGDVGRLYSEGSQVVPAHIRGLDDFEVWDMGGGGYDAAFMKQALKEARSGKAPGVIFNNMRDSGIIDATGPLGSPRAPSQVIAVNDLSRIRSPFAAFDPANMKKGMLLGAGATDPLGAALSGGAMFSAGYPRDR